MVKHYTGLRGKNFIQNIKEKEQGYVLKQIVDIRTKMQKFL